DATAWQEGDIDIYVGETLTVNAGDNGIEAESEGGNISFATGNGALVGISADEDGIELETEEEGTITVNAAGTINVGQDGIHTEADQGLTDIDFSGNITSAGADGIDARAWWDGNIDINYAEGT